MDLHLALSETMLELIQLLLLPATTLSCSISSPHLSLVFKHITELEWSHMKFDSDQHPYDNMNWQWINSGSECVLSVLNLQVLNHTKPQSHSGVRVRFELVFIVSAHILKIWLMFYTDVFDIQATHFFSNSGRCMMFKKMHCCRNNITRQSFLKEIQ